MGFDKTFWLAMLTLFVVGLAVMFIGVLTWPGGWAYMAVATGGSLMGNALGWSMVGAFVTWWESR